MQKRLSCLIVLLLSVSCASLDYDLAGVPLPISAKPAEPGASSVEEFRIEEKNILWIHGLLGQSQPDVVELLNERAQGYDRIAGLRISQGPSFHDWLLTHLSLSLIRMKNVVIEGQLVRD